MEYGFGSDEPRDDEAQQLVDTTANAIYEIGLKYEDLDFLAKIPVVAVALLTQVLHERDPHTPEDGDEGCRHATMIRALLSFNLAAGFAHRQYGPAELIAVIKAAATALSVGLAIDGYDESPASILAHILSDFNFQGWQESKDAMVETLLEHKQRISDQVDQLAADGNPVELPEVVKERLRARGQMPDETPEQVEADMLAELQQLLDQLGVQTEDEAEA